MLDRRFDPRALLDHAGPGKTITAFQPGTIIMAQGSVASSVYFLQSGLAKETVATEQGKGAVVNVLESGAFFGVSSIYFDAPMLSAVTAMTPCVVAVVDAGTMRLLLKQARFAEMFTFYLVNHSCTLEAEKIDLLFDNSERLLAKRLLALSHFGLGETQTIGPEVTQDMLAEMVGTTRPRVNFFLNKFRSEGLIKYNGGIRVQPGLAERFDRNHQSES